MSEALERKVLQPSPAHPIVIEPYVPTVTVTFAGQEVARTENALLLSEGGYDPVRYIPADDVDFGMLEATEHSTYCPYKGTANYYSVAAGGTRADNAVWQYKQPHDAVSQIAGYLAFYPNLVEIEG